MSEKERVYKISSRRYFDAETQKALRANDGLMDFDDPIICNTRTELIQEIKKALRDKSIGFVGVEIAPAGEGEEG